MGYNQRVGGRGEAAAVAYLEKRGYAILTRNFRCPFGEVDVIAKEGETLVFVEVKVRTSEAHGVPQESVTPYKQGKIIKTAMFYTTQYGWGDIPMRFDVLAILQSGSGHRYDYIPNAFDADSLQEIL